MPQELENPYLPADLDRFVRDETARYLNSTHGRAYIELAVESDPMLGIDDLHTLNNAETNRHIKTMLATYPGTKALAVHRVAHDLYTQAHALPAGDATRHRMLEAAEIMAKAEPVIEISPGTQIDEPCFIDHAIGNVMGETARVGAGTRMYHHVTLGALGRAPEGRARHPQIGQQCVVSMGVNVLGNVKVGNKVVLGPNSKLLGNDLEIGDGSRIGLNVEIQDGNRIAPHTEIGDGSYISKNCGDITIAKIPPRSFVCRDPHGELKVLDRNRAVHQQALGRGNGSAIAQDEAPQR